MPEGMEKIPIGEIDAVDALIKERNITDPAVLALIEKIREDHPEWGSAGVVGAAQASVNAKRYEERETKKESGESGKSEEQKLEEIRKRFKESGELSVEYPKDLD